VDVSYVGHHQWDALANTQNGGGVNLNAIDVGTTLGGNGLDPTVGGLAAKNNNLLRPFQGYSNINVQMPIWHRTFHSIQMSWQRRFSHGFSFQANDTWTLYDKGNTLLPGPQLRLIHNADATYSISPDQAVAEDLFADQGTTTHIIVVNGTWDLPDVKSTKSVYKGIGYLVNDWQLSGIFRADSGAPYDIGYSYNSGVSGQQLTGSPDYNSRIVINNLDAFGSGCSSNQYAQLDNTMVASAAGAASAVTTNAASGAQIGSKGLESGRNLFHACKNHLLDLAIQRSIRVGGGKSIVIRADMYNALKTVIINGRSTNIQFNSATDMSVRNSQFNADGTMATGRNLPNNAGFGAATGARDSFGGSNALRSIQLQVQFKF
jgi:hypothetical protein